MATFDYKIDTTKNTDSGNWLIYAFRADNPDGLEVDWGDGNSDTINDSTSTDVIISHTYSSHNEYTISISGSATLITCGGRIDHPDEGWTSFGFAVIDILTLPNDGITGITSCSRMFAYTSNLPASITANLNNWDVSSVTDMFEMFRYSSFDQDIGNWDTSSVTNMRLMFNNNSSFDQDLSRWCVPNVTDYSSFDNLGTDPTWGDCSYPHIKFQNTDNFSDVTIEVYTDSARTTLDATLTANDDGFAPYYAPSGSTTLYYTASKTGENDVENSITLGSCTAGDDCENVFTTEEFTFEVANTTNFFKMF